jgi:hypothetical protein
MTQRDRPARRGDPWPVRLEGARRAVVALHALDVPRPPDDWLGMMQAGAQQAERVRAMLLERRGDLRAAKPVEDEVTARVIAVLMECDAGCAHTRRPEDPPAASRLPWFLSLPHRQVVCRVCFTRDWLDPRRRPPKRVPDDRCDWCEAPTETFHEHLVQSATLLVLGDACGPCHDALMREGAAGAR